MSVRKLLFLAVVCVGLVTCLYLTARFVWLPPVTFRGHADRVFAVVASADGRTLASMSFDKTIKVWDVATGKERGTLRGSIITYTGSNATFNSNGKTLAWTRDKTIRLSGLVTGKEELTLRGHTDDVCSVAFSPDDKTLASGSCDTTVKLWDVATGKERATYRGHTAPVNHVKFSPDGKTLASASFEPDATIKLWDVTTGKERATLRVRSWEVECLSFSPDGKTLASGGERVRLWDVTTGTNTATLDAPRDGVGSVIFSPDGQTLAAVSLSSPEVFFWDVVSGKMTASWEKSYRRPRPRLLRYIWDAFPGTFEEHTYVLLSVLFTPDGKIVAFGFDNCDDTTVKMWRVAAVPSRKK